MGLLKPKGKHAQAAHAQDTDNSQTEDVEERESEPSDGPAAEAHAKSNPIITSLPEITITAEGDGSRESESADDFETLTMGGFAPVTSDGVVLHKKHRVGKTLGIVFGIIIGILLITYIAGAVVFMGRFFPETTIAGRDISMMSNEEVATLLDNSAKNYAIEVSGNGFRYRTTGSDMGLTVDSEDIIDAMHSDLNPWTWPALLLEGSHDETEMLEVSFKSQNFEGELTDAVNAFNETATAPIDASIAYDEGTRRFQVVKEVPGTQYDTSKVLAAMRDAISTLDPNVPLASDHLIQPKVFSTDERLINSAELATGLTSARITLTMAGQTAIEINGSNLSPFIHIDENFGVTLDEPALDQWVTDVSNGFDTIGTERTYTRADGKVITIGGGVYGWATDAYALKDQVVAAIKAGETTTIDIPCQQTADIYTGPGQRDWGNRYIDVDISEQVVRFYGDDGNIIWEAACISGSPDGSHDTVPGVWMVNDKQSPSKLVGYEHGVKIYETTVQYWMAFESSDIGFHDATWQPAFGGSMYASGYGSHGCVNLSYGDAESLYGIVEVGDCVVVHF